MRKPFATAALAVVLVAIAVSASEGEVNYREKTMEAIGGHMGAIFGIVRGDVPHTDHLATHASALADLAEIAPTLFPEGSNGGEALDAIWENPDDFASKLDAFREAAANLKTAVETGEKGKIMPAVLGVGQACKGCHDDYRAE